MAEDFSWHNSQKQSHSAVLEMESEEMDAPENEDSSDNNSSISDIKSQEAGRSRSKYEDLHQQIKSNMTQMVWQAGKQRAQQAWFLYGNIDILRPYFDVEPKELQNRLIYSLIPQWPTSQRQRVPKELYGPLMVILTLIALLLFQMKSSNHRVEEGTLMGTAFGVCFMYWVGASAFIWFLAYVCSVRIALLQVMSMMGYGLFGHCIVLFLGTILHTTHDHLLFYILWAVFGSMAVLRMAGIILSRASGKTERLIIIAVIAVFHMSFLLYLHFAYHTIVEELSEVFNAKPVPAVKPEVQTKPV